VTGSVASRHVALIGFMGAGKSTAGLRLAGRLSLPFVDLDTALEEAEGRSIPELFEHEGEEGFRAREAAALNRILAREPHVVATGGGVVESDANRAALRGLATVLWLDARLETLRERLGDGTGPERPLWVSLPAEELATRYRRRRPLYAETAHFRFETDDAPVGDLVRAMVLALRAHPASC